KRKTPPRYFLRVLLPFAVEGRDHACSWGIWVEVEEHYFNRAWDLWNDPDQGREPAFPGRLANDIEGYPATSSLTGAIQLQGPTSIPVCTLDPAPHPLVTEQEHGVTEEKVMHWLRPILHPR